MEKGGGGERERDVQERCEILQNRVNPPTLVESLCRAKAPISTRRVLLPTFTTAEPCPLELGHRYMRVSVPTIVMTTFVSFSTVCQNVPGEAS